MQSRVFSGLLTAAVGVAALMLVSSAQAVSIPLVVEFDDGTLDDYGTVDVVEDGLGDLDFTITLNTAAGLLGANADLREFYFNLVGAFTGLSIFDDNAPDTPYTLLGPNPPIAGGAGSAFDWGVSFDNGSSSNGNGILQFATFTLSADQALVLTDLNEFSNCSTTCQDVLVAAHIQGTQPFGSETVGGGPPGFVLPEPGTALLLGLGIAGLVASSRRRRE